MNNDNVNLVELDFDEDLKEQLKALVLERINVMPDNISLSVGTTEIGKSALMRHVEEEDEVGTQMMEMELDFLRDLASGAVYGE